MWLGTDLYLSLARCAYVIDAPVVQLEEGADAPHDDEDVKALVVLLGQDAVLVVTQVVFLRDQPLQEVTGLKPEHKKLWNHEN